MRERELFTIHPREDGINFVPGGSLFNGSCLLRFFPELALRRRRLKQNQNPTSWLPLSAVVTFTQPL